LVWGPCPDNATASIYKRVAISSDCTCAMYYNRLNAKQNMIFIACAQLHVVTNRMNSNSRERSP
jgi:hypothetical protein